MKAVGYTHPGPLDEDGALRDVELPIPEAEEHDLLVQVHAVSVNPVDCAIRATEHPRAGQPRVLGYDAVGTIVELGSSVEDEPLLNHFVVGDRVFYAGEIDRPGSNAEYQLVDAHLVAHAPASLSDVQAAALPLTGLTAWEMLFDRLEVTRPVPGAASAVVIIGGGGGVGSMAIQLLRALTNVTVIATASRPVTKAWCANLGAHHVLDHRRPLTPQVAELGLGAPGFVLSTAGSEERQGDILELLAPQGRFGYTDHPELDVQPFQSKCISLHPEDVFMRSRLQTLDLAEQGEILRQVGELVDAGKLRSTLTSTLGEIDAATVAEAHRLIESGTAVGKITLEGFSSLP